MARKKASRPETKSEFLRKALTRKPDLDHRQVNLRWAKSGHPGSISSPLYYKVRGELGIKTEWVWVRTPEPEPKGSQAPGPGGTSPTAEVFQWKVTLNDSEPPIWRRIQVGDCTLDRLHEHIQTAMGWTNSHMHHFRVDGKFYGDPRLLAETFGELNYADSTTTRLGDILPGDGRPFRFEYEYDFGDGWQHEILFEGRLPADPAKRYPLCPEGARACPPEDVGGVWGYADFLEAIGDRKHEAHREMREWIGRKFDPEAFNPVAATKRMKQGLPDW